MKIFRLFGNMGMSNLISYLKYSPITEFILSTIYIISGVIINLIQGLLYFGLRPFNKHLYRKINFYLSRSLCSEIVWLAVWWASVDVIFYVNQEDLKQFIGKEHACVIGNHHYDIDWLITWIVCDYLNILGNFKAYTKSPLKYIPTFGLNLYFGESIFVTTDKRKQNNCIKSQKELIINQLQELLDYKDPILLFLMAEGARFTVEKWMRSRKFAEQNGLPLLKYHLLPRTTGFITSIPYFQENFKAIYNTHLCFKKGERPTLRDLIRGKKIQAHAYLERIPIDQIPQEEKACANWLYNLFQRKDCLSDTFYETGDFFGRNGVKRVEGIHIPKTYFPLLNVLAWSTVILAFFTHVLCQLVIKGSVLMLSVVIGVILTFSQLVSKLIDLSDCNKGSTYGKKYTFCN